MRSSIFDFWKQASQGYQPWGRQGAGAPLRDGGGHVITNLRKKNGIMDYGEIQRGNGSSGSSSSIVITSSTSIMNIMTTVTNLEMSDCTVAK